MIRSESSANPCVVLSQFGLSMPRNKGHDFVEEVPCFGPVVRGFNAFDWFRVSDNDVIDNTSGVLDGARDGESVGVHFVEVDGVTFDDRRLF